MKITRVETLVLNLPMVIDGATPMLGGRARTSIDMLLVRIDTDAGVTGWGEAFGHRIFPATRAAIDTLLGPDVRGPRPERRSPRSTTTCSACCTGSAATARRSTRCPGSTSRCGTSRARWPALPLYRLLGGSAARRPAGLREPAALRRGRRRRALHRAGAGARLSPHQAARDHRARGEGGARRGRAPASRSWSTRTARGRCAKRSRWRDGSRRSICTGSRSRCGRRRTSPDSPRCAARGGIPTAAGENYGTAWEFRRAFEAGRDRRTRSRA